MSLENPTKINYGNVDDITPTEMNNIGLNFDTLGQKVQKLLDDVWVTTNADHDGANWNRMDTAKAATAQQIGIDGSITHYNVVSGANPIAWVEKFKVDALGNLVTGVVPLSQIGAETVISFGFVNNGVTPNSILMNHGLGTDSVQVLLLCDVAVAGYAITATRPDAYTTTLQVGTSSTVFGNIPGSGLLDIRMVNNTGGGRTFNVRVNILRQ